MTRSNLRDAYEFDPASYRMGLLGRLQPVVHPYQSGIPGASTRGRVEFDAANYDVFQAGLLGRLLALQREQSSYQPNPGLDQYGTPAASDPDFRVLSRRSNIGSTSIPPAAVDLPESIAQPSEADQAQRAREVAAMRLAGGGSRPGQDGPPVPPLYINGSARALANGVPGSLGWPFGLYGAADSDSSSFSTLSNNQISYVANEDSRNPACTRAAYACTDNLPSNMRAQCQQAEAQCNQQLNDGPFGPNVIDLIRFPDGTTVMRWNGETYVLPPKH